MDIFSSTKSRLLVLKAMQYLAVLSILDTILNYYKTNSNMKFILILMILMLQGNNHIRSKYLKDRKGKLYYLSYAISVIAVGYFTYELKCFGTAVYNVFLLIEIIVTIKKVEVLAVIFTFLVYCISNVPYVDLTKADSVKSAVINYLGSLFIVFLFRNTIIEKTRIEVLNKELKATNLKLKEFSNKIEELTIAKERTRIAQELHDSIGHSLVALKMNLEYAENVLELKPEKAKEVINKTQNISKDCITNLRKAVSLLKEKNSVKKLRESINELFQNFKETNRIKLILQMNDKVEAVSPDIKNCIYKTVREAVTNGIKHGNADVFDIEIFKESNMIILKVKNNGLECNNIVKSNGVKGIEERIEALGGKVKFNSEKGSGFTIEAGIPEME